MRILQVPLFQDNYCHLILDEVHGTAVAIDVGDAAPVLAAVESIGARLTHALCTHHHPDHVGGNLALARALPDLQIVGAAHDARRIPGLTARVHDGQTLALGALIIEVLAVPCHTRGHLAFLLRDPERGDALFCGDTLFVGGCGRFMEGDGAQMHAALNVIFGALAPQTRVFCAHEYTVSNLRFAKHIEPENTAIDVKLAWAIAQRAQGRSTVPSTLGQERTYNPFMRLESPAIQARTGEAEAPRIMQALRKLKNTF